LRHCPTICLNELKSTMARGRIAIIRIDIWTPDVPKTPNSQQVLPTVLCVRRCYCVASFTLPAEPSQTEPIRLGKQTNVMKWKHSHCTPSRTEPDRAWPSVFPDWCLFLLATRRPFLLRNRSSFLGLKCVCTQKRLVLVNKRLLRQILSINENTCTWFDILAVQKCQLQCAFSSGRFGPVQLGSACSVNVAYRSVLWCYTASRPLERPPRLHHVVRAAHAKVRKQIFLLGQRCPEDEDSTILRNAGNNLDKASHPRIYESSPALRETLISLT
jgi:hypothetical protein